MPYALAILLSLVFSYNAFALPKVNPANRFKSPLDEFSYDRATKCLKKPSRGALALQSWLSSNAKGVSWGIMRCEKWGKNSASLHAEGRAIDWHLDARDLAQKRAAYALIELLLEPDVFGQPFALARRMGIQGIIYDCGAWFGWEWGEYSACYNKKGKRKKGVDPTTAHQDHIHFEIHKKAAKLQTTYWERKFSK